MASRQRDEIGEVFVARRGRPRHPRLAQRILWDEHRGGASRRSARAAWAAAGPAWAAAAVRWRRAAHAPVPRRPAARRLPSPSRPYPLRRAGRAAAAPRPWARGRARRGWRRGFEDQLDRDRHVDPGRRAGPVNESQQRQQMEAERAERRRPAASARRRGGDRGRSGSACARSGSSQRARRARPGHGAADQHRLGALGRGQVGRGKIDVKRFEDVVPLHAPILDHRAASAWPARSSQAASSRVATPSEAARVAFEPASAPITT